MPDDPADLPALKKIEVVPGPRVLRDRPGPLAAARRAGPFRRRQRPRRHPPDRLHQQRRRRRPGRCQRPGRAAAVGEAAILCRYLDIIQCVRLTYLEPRKDFVWPNPPENNYVDRHVFAKLKLLNILPSDLCTDQEFLRRVLPGPVRHPADARRGRRRSWPTRPPTSGPKLIDQLLERPEFADFWTHKWLDLLRCNRLNLQIKGSHVYRQWLRRHVEDNTPWSQVVRELLTASGSTFSNPPANYYRGTYNNKAPVAVRDPQALAETTAQLFFGIRMQCAQCHNHPYERWTQDDYYHMAAWFAQVKAKADPLQPGRPRGRIPGSSARTPSSSTRPAPARSPSRAPAR